MKKNKKLTFILLALSFIVTGSISETLAGEAERNAEFERTCIELAKLHDNKGGPQVTPHCQTAIMYKCMAEKLCTYYPSECHKLKQRKIASCDIVNGMGYTCVACFD